MSAGPPEGAVAPSDGAPSPTVAAAVPRPPVGEATSEGVPPGPRSTAQEARRLLELSWPVIIGQLGWMGLGITDIVMSGRLGEEVLAAISVGHLWSFGVLIAALGLMRGMDPVFGQAHGAGDRERLRAALVQALVLGLVVSLPVSAAMLAAGPVLTLLGQPAEIVPEAATYCWIVSLGMAPALVFQALTQFLQGLGRMRPTMVAVWLANAVNIVLNGVLMFGWLGGWQLGAEGCAWATTVVRWLMVPMLLGLSWGILRDYPPPAGAWRDLPALRRLFGLGLPVGGAHLLEVWAFNAAGVMAGWLGPTAIAGHAVALNVASVTFMVPFGLSAGAATRVGNLVGAGLEWRPAARAALLMGGGFMACSGLALLLFPAAIGGLYTQDPPVLAVVITALPVAAAFQLFDGLQTVANGVLRGVGDLRFPAVAGLIAFWFLGLPAGYLLGIRGEAGVQGIWVGLVVGLFTVSVLLVGRVRVRMRRGAFTV